MPEPVLTIYGNVGPYRGGIRHGGDIRVFGSVLPGTTIACEGSLLVSRDVTAAALTAGGDIAVNGLVSAPGSTLDATGSIRVRQATDARLTAGLDLEVATAAERCTLVAGRRVLLTESPGCLRGGTVAAGVGFEATRVEPSAGVPAEIRIGPDPFPETAPEILRRQEFARSRREEARVSRTAPPGAYRRQVAGRRTWEALSSTLDRRLRQVRAADEYRLPPYLRVSGTGPVRARVELGPVKDALRDVPEQWNGGFVLLLDGLEVRAKSLEGEPHVG